MHISQRDDSSSLLPITEAQNTLFPGTSEVSTQDVQVAPLNDFVAPQDLRPPALLKIDVQGYELAVLNGCENRPMLDQRPTIRLCI